MPSDAGDGASFSLSDFFYLPRSGPTFLVGHAPQRRCPALDTTPDLRPTAGRRISRVQRDVRAKRRRHRQASARGNGKLVPFVNKKTKTTHSSNAPQHSFHANPAQSTEPTAHPPMWGAWLCSPSRNHQRSATGGKCERTSTLRLVSFPCCPTSWHSLPTPPPFPRRIQPGHLPARPCAGVGLPSPAGTIDVNVYRTAPSFSLQGLAALLHFFCVSPPRCFLLRFPSPLFWGVGGSAARQPPKKVDPRQYAHCPGYLGRCGGHIDPSAALRGTTDVLRVINNNGRQRTASDCSVPSRCGRSHGGSTDACGLGHRPFAGGQQQRWWWCRKANQSRSPSPTPYTPYALRPTPYALRPTPYARARQWSGCRAHTLTP